MFLAASCIARVAMILSDAENAGLSIRGIYPALSFLSVTKQIPLLIAKDNSNRVVDCCDELSIGCSLIGSAGFFLIMQLFVHLR